MPLFIGGVGDGEYHQPRYDAQYYTVRERTYLTAAPVFAPSTPTTRSSDYKRVVIKGEKESYTVWAEVTLTPDAVIARLIKNYASPQGEPQK